MTGLEQQTIQILVAFKVVVRIQTFQTSLGIFLSRLKRNIGLIMEVRLRGIHGISLRTVMTSSLIKKLVLKNPY